jgi:hypothetical protein
MSDAIYLAAIAAILATNERELLEAEETLGEIRHVMGLREAGRSFAHAEAVVAIKRASA